VDNDAQAALNGIPLANLEKRAAINLFPARSRIDEALGAA